MQMGGHMMSGGQPMDRMDRMEQGWVQFQISIFHYCPNNDAGYDSINR